MTSSTFSKKFISTGAALLLAAGGSLVATDVAQATDITSVTTTFTPQSGSTSISLNVSGCFINAFATPTPAPLASDFTVTGDSGSLTVGSVSLGQYISLSMLNALVGGDHLTISYVKNSSATNQIPCTTSGNFVGSFSGLTATVAAAPPTMVGTSGNLNGTVGTPLSMAAYSTTGLTSPVVYSYTVSGGTPIPAGVSFNTSTGQFTGTPTASASNLGVTVTATGANALTATASFNFTVTGGGGGGGGNPPATYTVTSAPSYSISNGVATANDGTWSGGTPTRYWVLCDTPIATGSATAAPMDCAPYYSGQTGGTYDRSQTITIPTTVWMTAQGGRVQVTFASKHLALFIINGGSYYTTATSGGPSQVVVTPTPAPTPVPAPVWQAPLLNAVVSMGKNLSVGGGKLALTEGDFSGLKSVTVGGKDVQFSTDSKGSVNIRVPAGKAGVADLTLVFTNATITILDGIKYVTPTDVAKVAEAPIVGFSKNSSKINPGLAATIQSAAQLDKKANTVLCTGYAASKAEIKTATARANAACGYATKVNDLLVNKTIKVVVNAKLAKAATVGIKVYK